MGQDFTDTTRSTIVTDSETLLPPMDRLPGTPMSPATDRRAGLLPTESALRDAKEAMTTINLSETRDGALERIKWVIDTLSPVAEVRYNIFSDP